jgi:hypothetical protein
MAGVVQIIPSPLGGGRAGGGVMAYMVAGLTATQQLTNTPTQLNFNITGDAHYGYISRTGNVFTVGRNGTYIFILEPQVRQDKNNNRTTIWAKRNGINVEFLGATFESASINDTNVLSVTATAPLAAGDEIDFWGITSLVAGASLATIPAAGGAPVIASCVCSILGFATIGPSFGVDRDNIILETDDNILLETTGVILVE